MNNINEVKKPDEFGDKTIDEIIANKIIIIQIINTIFEAIVSINILLL